MEQNRASPWCSEPRDINLRFNFYPIIDFQFAKSNILCLKKCFLWKNLFKNFEIQNAFLIDHCVGKLVQPQIYCNLTGIIYIVALNFNPHKNMKKDATESVQCYIWTLAQSHSFCNWQDKKKEREAVHIYNSIFPAVKRRQCSLVRPGQAGWSGHVSSKWTRLNWLSPDWTFEWDPLSPPPTRFPYGDTLDRVIGND